jgi:two-component system, NarL family, nitrate/nitrite response regulator NarL
MGELDQGCIRVIVADPSPVVLSGFERFFDSPSTRIAMLAGVPTLRHLQRRMQEGRPDVAIIDWGLVMRDMSESLDLIREVAKAAKILFAAMPDQATERRQAFQLGAKGFISKHSSSIEICRAINKIAGGGIWIEKQAAEALLQLTFTQDQHDQPISARIARLTPRERQIVDCVCKGQKSKAIAVTLHISETTVAHHLTSVFSKLQVQDRVGLVAFAYWHQLHVQQRPHAEASRGLATSYFRRATDNCLSAVDRQKCS